MPADPRRPRAATTMVELWEQQAELHGDAPFLDDGDRRLGYAGLLAEARRAAAVLRGRGLGHGDRIVLSGPNSVDWVAVCAGAHLAGATVVPVGHRLTGDDRRRVLDVTRPRLVVADRPWEGVVARLTTEQALAAGDVPAGSPVRVRADDTAFVMRTSGTTGPGRFVPIEHGQLLGLYADLATRLRVDASDVLLGVAPLAHGFGLFGVLLAAALSGASVRLVGRYDRATIADVVVDSAVTALVVPHAVLHDLATSGCGDRPHRLRLVVTGGEEVVLPRLREACRRLGVDRVAVGYGLTEAYGTVAFADASAPTDDPLPALRLLPGREIRLVTADGSDVAQGSGGEGEIVVRGAAVMSGYLPEADQPGSGLDREGWLHTGDLARWAADGTVQVCARLKDTVIVGGFNVVPAEVEQVVEEDPAVAAVMVVGIPDPRAGEQLVAGVVARAGHAIDEEGLLAHCRERLAGYKVPRRVMILDALPTTASGKRSRRGLRARILEQPGPVGSGPHTLGDRDDDLRRG